MKCLWNIQSSRLSHLFCHSSLSFWLKRPLLNNLYHFSHFKIFFFKHSICPNFLSSHLFKHSYTKLLQNYSSFNVKVMFKNIVQSLTSWNFLFFSLWLVHGFLRKEAKRKENEKIFKIQKEIDLKNFPKKKKKKIIFNTNTAHSHWSFSGKIDKIKLHIFEKK